MSADAVAYVWRFSPYKGAGFAVHHAIADSVNDQHSYRLWMSRAALAIKARVSLRSVHDALAALEQDGFLTRLRGGQMEGEAIEYRFVFKRHIPPIWEPKRAPQPVDKGSAGIANPLQGSAHPSAISAHKTQEELEPRTSLNNLKVITGGRTRGSATSDCEVCGGDGWTLSEMADGRPGPAVKCICTKTKAGK